LAFLQYLFNTNAPKDTFVKFQPVSQRVWKIEKKFNKDQISFSEKLSQVNLDFIHLVLDNQQRNKC